MPDLTTDVPGMDDPRLVAGIDALRRTGMLSLQIRWSDDEQPIVWMAVGEWNRGADGIPVNEHRKGTRVHVAAAGMNPTAAVTKLLDETVDGGLCMHCKRPCGVTDDWRADMPLADVVCWYQYDPETQKYARGCAGDVPKQGRNDPCFCGSGKKYKACHGR